MPVWISVEGGQQLKALSKELKEAGRGDLKKKLRKEIRDASKPVVRDVQSAVMAVNVSSTKRGTAYPDESTGLRARVAKATGLSITQSGIRIRVSARKVGRYGATLPKYLGAETRRSQRWRHPVFQTERNPDTWAEQKGSPYFFSTINRHTRDFRRAVFRAMDDVSDELTK